MRQTFSIAVLSLLAAPHAGAQVLEPFGVPDLGSTTFGFFVSGPAGTTVTLFMSGTTSNPPVSIPGVGEIWVGLTPPPVSIGPYPLAGFYVPIPPDGTLLDKVVTVQGILVASSPFSLTATNPLRVRVGPPASVSPPPGSAVGNFGFSVAAGNLSGGSEVEIVVGAPPEINLAGAAYVYGMSGGALSLLSTLTPGPSGQPEQFFGHSLAIGDVDGDGSNDLLVGSPGWDAMPLGGIGRAYLFYGPALTGATALSPPISHSLSGLSFGWSVAIANLDGSGHPEIVVGAPMAFSTSANEGRVFVFSGVALGSTATVTPILDPLGPYFAFGKALAVGDLTGDGIADLAVGAPDYGAIYPASGPASVGRVDVFSGPTLGLAYTLADPTPEHLARFGAALAVGDLTGDGTGDLLVGRRAAAYVFAGGAAGTAPVVGTLLPPLATGLVGESFGKSVAIGDLDGDLVNDAVVGQTVGDAPEYQGRAWVFYGSPGGSPFFALRSRLIVVDPVAALLFATSLAVGDLGGTGAADLFVGSPSEAKVYWFPN